MKKTLTIFLLCLTLCLAAFLTACGDSNGSSVSGGGGCKTHEFGEARVIAEPNCTESGSAIKNCKNCGIEDHVSIDPIGHDLEVEAESPNTCTADGYRNSVCARCGYYESLPLPATGHTCEYEISTTPTKTGVGYYSYSCVNDNCTYWGSGELPKLTDESYVKETIDEDNFKYTYTTSEGEALTFDVSNFIFGTTDMGEDWPFKFNTYVIIGYDGEKTELTLPTTHNGGPVTGIYDQAFDYTDVTSIVIPESDFTYTREDVKDEWLEEFDQYAQPEADGKYHFGGYDYIGYRAFEGAAALTSVTLPSTLSSISNSAFAGCTSLESINLDKVSYIDAGVFANCTSLESVNVSSLEALNYKVFSDCSSLTSVTFSSSLEKIYSNAFENCTSLTEFVIPDSVTFVGAAILKGCSGITSLTAPNLCGNSLAVFFSGLDYVENDVVVEYYNTDVDSIPASLVTVTITRDTEIGRSAFESCSRLKTVNYLADVTSIGERAFNGCSSLEGFKIPDSVTSVGKSAFGGVDPFKFNQDFDNKTYYIPSETNPYFYLLAVDYVASGEVVIREGCKFVEQNAFEFVSGDNVTAIRIPSSIEKLGTLKMSNGYGVSTSLNVYFDGTVERFTELDAVITGWENMYLYVRAGADYAEVTELVISDKVTEIQTASRTAYGHFRNITSVRIPASVKKINSFAFRFYDLTSVYYDGTLADWCAIEFMNEEANPLFSTEHFYVKGGSDYVEVAGSVILPEGATIVNRFVFCGFSGITELMVPSSVEGFYPDAFEDCDNLTALYYCGTATEWDDICYASGSLPVSPCFYSEATPSIEDFLAGRDQTLWHYGEGGKPEAWSTARGNTVDTKTYVHIASSVTVTDEYWQLVLMLKQMDAVDQLEDPTLIPIIEASNTKAELEENLADYYLEMSAGITFAFANGQLTLSDGTDSTQLEYLELDGVIYYVLTGGKAFDIKNNGAALDETIVNEYITVVHSYAVAG